MKKFIYNFTILILFTTALALCVCGIVLIFHRSGLDKNFSATMLSITPVSEYLLPGILLLSFAGVLSVHILSILDKKEKQAGIY